MALGQGSNRAEILYDHIHKAAKVYPTMLAGITVAKGDASWALTAASMRFTSSRRALTLHSSWLLRPEGQEARSRSGGFVSREPHRM
jgi:hypothetical protein